MKNNSSKIVCGLTALLLGSATIIACDDGAIDGEGGAGGGGGAASSGGSSNGTGGRTSTGGGDNQGGGGGDAPVEPEVPAVISQTAKLLDNAINPYGALFASDGKLYISGTTDTSAATAAQASENLRLAVWRLNADGSLDTEWGTDGKVIAADIVNPGTSYDIVELADGSFVVHYSGNAGVFLVKLSAAGVFGTPVKIEVGWTQADREALQALVDDAHAECELNDSSEECLTARAAVTAAWPAAGTDLSGRPGQASSWGIALDKSGSAEKIVVFLAGPAAKVSTGTQRTDSDRYITRVLASDLSVDPAFNGGAAFTLDVNGAGLSNNARRGLVLADGSIVSTGYTSYTVGGNHVELIKLLPNGTPDTSFGFSESAPGSNFAVIEGLAFFNPFQAGQAEAYSAVSNSTGALVTTGYGVSNFDTTTAENDLVSFAVLGDGLDLNFGGNASDALFGSAAVQSEGDPNAGFGVRPYRENGRDIVVLGDDRTIHVGCYDDAAAIFVLTADGKLDASVGNGTGRLQYSYPSPFFKAAISADGTRIAATATSRAKVTTGTGSYAKAFLALVNVEAE